ncbi:hypothetical protein [Saccharothrix xinjiangensis]|uniref:ABC transporter permease n=1 Tax=Saccharothrix xinjiangensis TaxID=204798 RepID=A0ABV9Y7X0_9PSEU
MRILGIELRRTSAPVMGLVTVAVLLFMLDWGPAAKNSTAWTGQWSSLAEWSRFMLLLAWPLVIGGGALLGMRDRRSGVEELFASTPRPRAQRVLRTLGASAAALVAAYAVVVVVGAVRMRSDYFHWGWLPVVLVGVLSLVAASWVGVGLGRLAPWPLTPPVAAVATFALMALAQSAEGGGYRFALLTPVVRSPDSVFEHVAGVVTTGQAVWFAGLALTGFLLVALRRWWPAALPALVAGAVAVPLMPATPAGALSPDPVAAELVCADGLCLTRAHEGERAALAGPAREALRQLAKLPSPPVEVREAAGAVLADERGPDAPEAVWVRLDEFTYFRASGEVAPEKVVEWLVAGAGTRSCVGEYVTEDITREVAFRTVAAAWVTGELRPLPVYRMWIGRETDAVAATAWEVLRALPEAEQAARVQAAREVQAACSGDPLTALTGTPA